MLNSWNPWELGLPGMRANQCNQAGAQKNQGTGTLVAGRHSSWRCTLVALLDADGAKWQATAWPSWCSTAWRSHRCLVAAAWPENLTMANVMNAPALLRASYASARPPCSVSSPQKLLSYFVSPNTSFQGKSNPSSMCPKWNPFSSTQQSSLVPTLHLSVLLALSSF